LGSLIKEIPHSEVTATLEVLARYGVSRESLTLIRSEPELASRVSLLLNPPELDPDDDAEETVGQRLRRLRLERGLSQRELSGPGVSYAYISRIEAGERQPSVKALRKLAEKLGVSPDYLETGRDTSLIELVERVQERLPVGQRLIVVDVHEQARADIDLYVDASLTDEQGYRQLGDEARLRAMNHIRRLVDHPATTQEILCGECYSYYEERNQVVLSHRIQRTFGGRG
jgi:transcriptional regulator with XRE-family HTH domain